MLVRYLLSLRVCLTILPLSQVGVLLRWLNVGFQKVMQQDSPGTLVLQMQKNIYETLTTGTPNAGGVGT